MEHRPKFEFTKGIAWGLPGWIGGQHASTCPRLPRRILVPAGSLSTMCVAVVLGRYRLVRQVRLLVQPLLQRVPNVGPDTVDELCYDGRFIEHPNNQSGLFAYASRKHFLLYVRRLAHPLECTESIRKHRVCGILQQEPVYGVRLAENAIDSPPRTIESDAKVSEEITLE